MRRLRALRARILPCALRPCRPGFPRSLLEALPPLPGRILRSCGLSLNGPFFYKICAGPPVRAHLCIILRGGFPLHFLFIGLFAALCAAHAAFRLAHGGFSCPRAVFLRLPFFRLHCRLCRRLCLCRHCRLRCRIRCLCLGRSAPPFGRRLLCRLFLGLFRSRPLLRRLLRSTLRHALLFPRLRRLFCRIRRLAFLFRGSLWFAAAARRPYFLCCSKVFLLAHKNLPFEKIFENARRRKKQKCRLPKKRALQSSGNAAARNSKQIFLYYL